MNFVTGNNDFIPAISVIIPMFNAEKYIKRCLESVLAQSFKDFEVIVVDDVSTDRSVEIVEEIAPKFDGRLKLIKRKTNSGGCAVPRNIGLSRARGKYVFFIDNDDMIMPNALEILHSIAEKTVADVVHAERWYEPQNPGIGNEKTVELKINTFELGKSTDKIMIETSELAERIRLYTQRRFHWHVWNKFFRRDFLIENDIEFPAIFTGEDTMFCFFCLCLAKTYVRIPNVFYIWDTREDSVSRRFGSLETYLKKYVAFFVECTDILNSFMDGLELFNQQPQYRYMVLDFFIRDHHCYITKLYKDHKSFQIEPLLRAELQKTTAERAHLTRQLFHLVNIYRLQIDQFKRVISALQKQLEGK